MTGHRAILCCLVALLTGVPSEMMPQDTLSLRQAIQPSVCILIARDSLTGDLGAVALSSTSGIGTGLYSGKADAGVLAVNGGSRPEHSALGLALLAQGRGAGAIVDSLLGMLPASENFQIGVINGQGESNGRTGLAMPPYAGALPGYGFCVIGSNLRDNLVLITIARVVETSTSDFPEKLLAALAAGINDGGMKTPGRSAVLTIYRETPDGGDHLIDLSVTNDTLPVEALKKKYDERKMEILETRLGTLDLFTKKKLFTAAQTETRRLAGLMNSILREKPDAQEILNRIASYLVSYEIDVARALDLSRRAVTLAPGRTDFMDVEAQCLYRAGRIDEAVALENELIRKEPANPAHRQHLEKYRSGGKQ